MRRVKQIAVAACVLLAFGAAGLVCSRVADRGRFAVPYSTYGAGPQGTRGLYLLTARLGQRAQRWDQDLARLPPRGLLVALGGCEAPMYRSVSRYEHTALARFVRGGGVLLVAGAIGYLRNGDDTDGAAGKDDEAPHHVGGHESGGGHAQGKDRDHTKGRHQGKGRDQRDRDGHGAPAGRDRHQDQADALPVWLARDSGSCSPTQALFDDLPSGASDGGVPDGAAPDPAHQLGQDFESHPEQTLKALAQDDPKPPPDPAVPVGPLAGLDEAIPLREPAHIELRKGTTAETLLELSSGPGGVAVKVGKGTIVVLASASPFENRALESADGGALFARLLAHYAPDGPVLFDEYHLGVGARRSVARYVRQIGGVPIVLQLLVVVGLVLLRIGTRFGVPRRPVPPAPAGTASYVAGVGQLYEKSHDSRGVMQILVRQALARIAEHHHVTGGDVESLAEQLSERGHAAPARAVREMGALLERPPEREADLVDRAHDIDGYVTRATEAPTAFAAGSKENVG